MLPFLAILIVFCLILAFYIRKNDAAQQKAFDDFWEKERASNAVRKQDISKLDYITIPLEKIPVKLETSVEESFFALGEKQILDLTGISNTDLKLQYGTANLAFLSECDANFMALMELLPQYTSELIASGEIDTAKMLLDFAVSVHADSHLVHKQLEELSSMH